MRYAQDSDSYTYKTPTQHVQNNNSTRTRQQLNTYKTTTQQLQDTNSTALQDTNSTVTRHQLNSYKTPTQQLYKTPTQQLQNANPTATRQQLNSYKTTQQLQDTNSKALQDTNSTATRHQLMYIYNISTHRTLTCLPGQGSCPESHGGWGLPPVWQHQAHHLANPASPPCLAELHL